MATMTEWPENLWREIYQPGTALVREGGQKPIEMDDLDACPDTKLTLFVMAVANLTRRQQVVLMYRYALGLTLEETGAYFGVTKERVRQAEVHALRRMSQYATQVYGKTLRQVVDGIAARHAEHDARQLAEQYIKEHQEELRPQLQQDALLEVMDEVADLKRPRIGSLTLEDLGLSVRAYNCLKRGNINTVEELIRKVTSENGIKELLEIRNMGKYSVYEVLRQLIGHGVELPEHVTLPRLDRV